MTTDTKSVIEQLVGALEALANTFHEGRSLPLDSNSAGYVEAAVSRAEAVLTAGREALQTQGEVDTEATDEMIFHGLEAFNKKMSRGAGGNTHKRTPEQRIANAYRAMRLTALNSNPQASEPAPSTAVETVEDYVPFDLPKHYWPQVMTAMRAYAKAALLSAPAMPVGELPNPIEDTNDAWDHGWNACLKAVNEALAAARSQPVREPLTLNRPEIASYVARYGGMCRDCADENGICPNSGMPCDSGKAIDHVLSALDYGLTHGYIAAHGITKKGQDAAS